MIGWIRRWWWARQRSIDLQVLWPSCRDQAESLTLAHYAFMMHAFTQPCWVCVYGERLWDEVQKLR